MGTSLQFEHFHLLLLRKDATELLLDRAPSGARLPVLTIPANQRTAEELTRAVWNSWGVGTYALLTLPIEDSVGPVAVLELTSPAERFPGEMQWRTVGSLCSADFDDAANFAAMKHGLEVLDHYRQGKLPGSFAKPGCFRTVTAWVKERATETGLRLNGTFRHVNAGPSFSLVRFETDGPGLWFKAVGPPNLHEYGISLTLAARFPGFVPQIVGSRPAWSAWLTKEAQGTHPDEASEIRTWATIARRLADLQHASFGQALDLLDLGCRDVRIDTLLRLVDPFVDVMAGVMEQQKKDLPARLSPGELRTLGAQLQDVLLHFESLGVPNLLGHLDLNPGNILVSLDQCVFLDWAEAYVGPPFLTFQYILEHLRRLCPARGGWEQILHSEYFDGWQSLVPENELREAAAATPLLAVFAYAVSWNAWANATRRAQPDVAAVLRSMTRSMKREADALALRRSTCLR